MKIWNTRGSDLSSTTSQTIISTVKTLKHTFAASISEKNNIKDVTSIDWNVSLVLHFYRVILIIFDIFVLVQR